MFFEYRYHITIQLGFIFPDKLKVSDNSIRKFDFENVPFDNSYTHGLIWWWTLYYSSSYSAYLMFILLNDSSNRWESINSFFISSLI